MTAMLACARVLVSCVARSPDGVRRRIAVACFVSVSLAMVAAGTVRAAVATDIATAPARPVRMTVVGDSLALGIGASDSSRGFAFDLFRRVLAAHPGSEVTNLAIGGATTADVLRLELGRIAATRPDILLIEAGANDLVRHRSARAFATDEARLVAGARRAVPHARIVLFNVPDISVSPIFEAAAKPGLRRLARAYDAALAAIARRAHAPIVDLFAFSQAAKADPARYFSADEFHPSDAGHAAIASDAWPIVRAALAP